MTQFAISNPAFIVNNSPIAIIPNSAKYDDGVGETTVRNQSTGAGGNELVISENAEENIGTCSCDMMNTIDNMNAGRGYKKNPGVNFVQITGDVGGKSFSRTYNSASVMNKPEFELSTDGKFTLEWGGEQPI